MGAIMLVDYGMGVRARGPDPDQADYIQGDKRFPVTNLTPDVFIQRRTEPGWHFRNPEGGYAHDPAGQHGHLYTHPYPISDRQFLVSYKVNPSDHYQAVPNAYAIYLIDTEGSRRAIHADPELSCWHPLPLVARPVPPRLESFRDPQLAARDEQLKALRAQSSVLQEKRSQVELELVRRQGDLRYLDETCRKDLSIAVAELAAARDQSLPEPDEIAVAEAEDKVSDLKRRIESLGPVNPEALTEYQESQQRYDFLNTQRQDLIDSIRDTEKAINEIDVESRKRFTEAFGVINENFKEMFRVLFGGGMGEMRLTGEGDALDQGIEIQAQPPGKRLQNVQLLSGGEKALTAISLLMAIFRYQPSPFCILDEVDAPLDEVNVGRLSQLLKDMAAAQTQFIVITHAKKSMEMAEMLYGVTMQEQGRIEAGEREAAGRRRLPPQGSRPRRGRRESKDETAPVGYRRTVLCRQDGTGPVDQPPDRRAHPEFGSLLQGFGPPPPRGPSADQLR